MRVRAKFKVDRIERSSWGQYDPETKTTKAREIRTIVLSPVMTGSEENARFFAASSPSGEIRLGVVNEEAWGAFELGQETYVDFADQASMDDSYGMGLAEGLAIADRVWNKLNGTGPAVDIISAELQSAHDRLAHGIRS